MAGPSMEDDSDLKGMSKIFNSRTMSGRANVAKLSLAGYLGLILYFTYFKKSK